MTQSYCNLCKTTLINKYAKKYHDENCLRHGILYLKSKGIPLTDSQEVYLLDYNIEPQINVSRRELWWY